MKFTITLKSINALLAKWPEKWLNKIGMTLYPNAPHEPDTPFKAPSSRANEPLTLANPANPAHWSRK